MASPSLGALFQKAPSLQGSLAAGVRLCLRGASAAFMPRPAPARSAANRIRSARAGPAPKTRSKPCLREGPHTVPPRRVASSTACRLASYPAASTLTSKPNDSGPSPCRMLNVSSTPMDPATSSARGCRSAIATDAAPRSLKTAAASRPISPAPLTKQHDPSMRPTARSIPCNAMANGSTSTAVRKFRPSGRRRSCRDWTFRTSARPP